MTPFRHPSPALVAMVRQESERALSAEEFDAWVRAPWSAEDRAQALDLIEWFGRRYPTPAARLAAGRAAYRRARELMPPVV